MIGINFDAATTSLASAMIDDAEAEVNKYLSRRYDLSSATFQTSTSVPPIVRALTTTLAEGYMWERLSRGSKESLSRGKNLVDQVLKNLGQIASYKVDLVNTTGSLITDMSNTAFRVLSSTTDYSTTFNEDEETDWEVDPDKLDDISSERG